jgi:hypothetical protein
MEILLRTAENLGVPHETKQTEGKTFVKGASTKPASLLTPFPPCFQKHFRPRRANVTPLQCPWSVISVACLPGNSWRRGRDVRPRGHQSSVSQGCTETATASQGPRGRGGSEDATVILQLGPDAINERKGNGAWPSPSRTLGELTLQPSYAVIGRARVEIPARQPTDLIVIVHYSFQFLRINQWI